MTAGSQLPGSAASNYWLRRCEGFRVDSTNGRVGFVEEVRYASRSDCPDVIVVRAGIFGRLLLVVPVAEIAEIVPREELVVLRHSPRRTHAERLREVTALINRLRHLVDPRRRRGGEREMTPDVEAPAEPSAEEPPAEQEAGEQAAAEEAPAEEAAEAAPAEEPAAGEPSEEESPAEEEPTV